jgi:RHS repeat-associated protein
VQTDELGVIEQSCSSLPFGDGLSCTGSITFPSEHHFTGKERDTESGNDYFGARYYASSMGRWLSPDPKIISKQRMYDPQQWNMYSYARNNPLGAIDPDGREIRALTDLALQRIQNTLPKDVRSQIKLGDGRTLDRKSIDAIKNTDSNVKLLQRAVDNSKVIDVTTASGAGGDKFFYQSVADQKSAVIQAGGDASGAFVPSLYLGLTQTPNQSGTGNILVTLSDGTGSAAGTPESEQETTAAHEIYGHAVPMAEGNPWEHAPDENGPVDKGIKQIEDHTRELQKKENEQ